MTKLTLIFNADPSRYQGDAAKIAYAASYLSGSAADWFEPHLDKNTGKVKFDSYAEFTQALKNTYDDPDARTTTEWKLHAFHQNDKDCSTYHSEFVTYATTLRHYERTKISFFINGANHGLQTVLSYQASTTEVFDDFIQLCIKLENKVQLLKAPKRPTPADSCHGHEGTNYVTRLWAIDEDDIRTFKRAIPTLAPERGSAIRRTTTDLK